jgi:hypothetical protein
VIPTCMHVLVVYSGHYVPTLAQAVLQANAQVGRCVGAVSGAAVAQGHALLTHGYRAHSLLV